MTESLTVTASVGGGCSDPTLYCHGVLDRLSYCSLRNTVVKSALDEPRAVLVDVNNLQVPEPSAWTAFTSARWHVSTWPDVPILLICADSAVRELVRRRGITRYVPVYSTLPDAVHSMAEKAPRERRRARAELSIHVSSIIHTRELVESWLTLWACPTLIPVCTIIAMTLVENALRYTDSVPVLRVEYDGAQVIVAVEDNSGVPAQRKELLPHGPCQASGLTVVAALARLWGNIPTPSGKTVWAVVGPENAL